MSSSCPGETTWVCMLKMTSIRAILIYRNNFSTLTLLSTTAILVIWLWLISVQLAQNWGQWGQEWEWNFGERLIINLVREVSLGGLGFNHIYFLVQFWGFPDSSVGKESAGDPGSIPGLGSPTSVLGAKHTVKKDCTAFFFLSFPSSHSFSPTSSSLSLSLIILMILVLPRWPSGKEPTCNAGAARDLGLIPG